MHVTLRRLTLPVLAVLACGDGPPPGPDQPGDTIPPVIVATRPAAGDTGVRLRARVEVTFSEPLNWATLGPASFFLLREAEPVAGGYQVDRTTAAFVPGQPFDSLTIYSVLLTRGIRDSAGNQLPADSSWSFRTGGTAPARQRASGACETPPCGAR
jgi:type IV pilus assembly protein PilY1